MRRPTPTVCPTIFRLAITIMPTSFPRPRQMSYHLIELTTIPLNSNPIRSFLSVRFTDCRKSSCPPSGTSWMNILQRDSFDPPNLQVEHPSSSSRRKMGHSDFVSIIGALIKSLGRTGILSPASMNFWTDSAIPDRPWESISADFIVELPPSVASETGVSHNAILVVIDRLTKMAHFIPTDTTATSSDLARLYVKYVFSKHGVPSDIVSDRGSTFTSQFMSSLGRLLNIKLNYSTAYHPQTDGQTERTNQQIEGYLRLYANYDQNNWSDLLPIAEFAYNNAQHSTTQVSPFFANYSYNPRATLHLDVTVPDPTAHDFSQDLSALHQYCREQIKIAQAQYQLPP